MFGKGFPLAYLPSVVGTGPLPVILWPTLAFGFTLALLMYGRTWGFGMGWVQTSLRPQVFVQPTPPSWFSFYGKEQPLALGKWYETLSWCVSMQLYDLARVLS